jgi:hypothetical protein
MNMQQYEAPHHDPQTGGMEFSPDFGSDQKEDEDSSKDSDLE